MKKLFIILFAVAVALFNSRAQTGFRNSANSVLPFKSRFASNDVVNIGTTGSPISPTNGNIRLGDIVEQVKTNFDAKHANALDTSPVNPQELKALRAKLYSKSKATLSFLGDSVGQDVQAVIETALLPFMGRAGAVAASTPTYLGNYFYNGVTGTTTYYDHGLNGVFWGAFSALGSGAVLTTASGLSNGIAGDSIGFAWVAGGYGGAGSMLVETQQVSGSWGTLKTLSSATGSFDLLTTNVAVPFAPNYVVRITSTGSNIPVAVAIRDTRSGAGFISSATTTPGVSPIGIMQTCGSNNVAKFIVWQNPDVVFYKAERLLTITNELPWFDTLLSNTVPKCDAVWIPYHDNTAPDEGLRNRDYMIFLAKSRHRAVVDTLAESRNFFTSTNNALYQSDAVHLQDIGRAVLHARVPAQLGIGVDEMLALGFAFPQTNDSSKAVLSGGNNFVGSQIIQFLEMQGATAQIGLWNAAGDNKFVWRRVGSDFQMLESSASYNIIYSVSNFSGNIRLDAPYSNGGPELGIGNPWVLNTVGMFTKSNPVSSWPTVPRKHGDAYWANSNGIIYVLTSGVGLTWTATNKIAP